MNVVGYCRLSKDDNKSRYSSIEAQQELALDYAKRKGWEIQKFYIDDDITGFLQNEKRPEFYKMLQAIDEGNVDVVIGRDNVLMGQAVGNAIVAALGGKGNAKGKILEVMGSGGDRVQEARSKGFHNAVDSERGIEVIQSPHCDYVRSKAATATQDIIQRHRDIVLIYGHNDDMSLGALQVCEDAGLKVMCSGVDGLMEAVEAITKGRYLATSANDPFAFGQMAVEVAVKLMRGESVGKEVDAGTFLIDSSNARQYFDPSIAFAKKK